MIRPIPGPPKRARVDADESSATPPLPQVKYERSPSPLTVERKLVTSGTKRFAPIPDDCLPFCAEYKQNRSEWVAMCVKELEELNLIPERRLFRDDGLVIDWKSHIPVWSDTLKPNTRDLAATIVFAHESNAQWHPTPVRKESHPKSVPAISTQDRPSSPPSGFGDVLDPPLKKRLPVPPRPSSTRRNILVSSPPRGPGPSPPRPEKPRLPERMAQTLSQDHATSPSVLLPQHGLIGVPANSSSKPCNQSAASGTCSAAEEEMSEMTLDYLRRYVQTYESDRASLASAYASNASFAYRVHHIVQNVTGSPSPAWAATPRCFSSGTKRTRLDIVTTLLTLPCLHSSDTVRIEYDIFYLGTELGMFVKKEFDAEDAAIEGVWPLTATAHQILVFET